MQGTETFGLMAIYNQWMNEKLYDTCSTIPDVDRKSDKGAFFGSIHGTLNHLMFGDYAWMNRLANRQYEIKAIGDDYFDSFDEMRSARTALDKDIIGWTTTITPDWLAEKRIWVSKAYDKEFSHANWQLATHMFNHQTHHRGQLTTLISQLGKDVGPTDIPFMT